MNYSPEENTESDDFSEEHAPLKDTKYLENRKPRVQALQLRRKIEELEDARRLKELLSYENWND